MLLRVHVLLALVGGLLGHQRDDDLYQSLVYSHYLQRQGIGEPGLYSNPSYNSKRDANSHQNPGLHDPYSPLGKEPSNYVTPVPGEQPGHYKPQYTAPSDYQFSPAHIRGNHLVHDSGPEPFAVAPAPVARAISPYGGNPAPYGASPLSYGGSPSAYAVTPAPYAVTPAPYAVTPAPYAGTPVPFAGTPAPYAGTPASYAGTPASYAGTPAPYAGTNTPYARAPAPYAGTNAPYAGTNAPYKGAPAPYAGAPAPYAGAPAPYAGTSAPYAGAPDPYVGTPAPYGGAPAPYAKTLAPYAGTPAPYGGTPVSYGVTSAPYYHSSLSHPYLKQLSPIPPYSYPQNPQYPQYAGYLEYPRHTYQGSHQGYHSQQYTPPHPHDNLQSVQHEEVQHSEQQRGHQVLHQEPHPGHQHQQIQAPEQPVRQGSLHPPPSPPEQVHRDPVEPVNRDPVEPVNRDPVEPVHRDPVEQIHRDPVESFRSAPSPPRFLQRPSISFSDDPEGEDQEEEFQPSRFNELNSVDSFVKLNPAPTRVNDQPTTPFPSLHQQTTPVPAFALQRTLEPSRIRPTTLAPLFVQPDPVHETNHFQPEPGRHPEDSIHSPEEEERGEHARQVPIFTVARPNVAPEAKLTSKSVAAPSLNRVREPESGKAPKTAALLKLYEIAGEDWDPSQGIEKSLSDSQHKFQCPAPEGHFPDPVSCDVYHQCAHGTPTKYTCSGGLKWNVATDQCDWENNVDCSLNTQPLSSSPIYRYYKV